MKVLIILSIAFLTGCATTQNNVVEVPKIKADTSIMKSCPDFVYPETDLWGELLKNVAENKVVWAKCNALNEMKKDFINKY